MRCTRLVMVALAACAATASGARAAKEDVYALVGARVVPVSGPVLENGTVLLRDGVIEAVGAKVTLPLDARVIDARGLTVTPGLIDGFGGLGLPAARPNPPRRGRRRPPGRRDAATSAVTPCNRRRWRSTGAPGGGAAGARSGASPRRWSSAARGCCRGGACC